MNSEPRLVKAKRDTECPQTGLPILKGDAAVYFPAAKKHYHLDSEAAKQAQEMRYRG